MNRKQIPTTYDEAREMLKGRTSRTIANNTALVDLGAVFGPGVKEIGLRLHSTYVVRFFGDGTITLHTGGWETVTTKDRLNRVALAHGFRVFSDKRVWKIARFGRWHEAVDFEDGFTIPAPARDPEPDAQVESCGSVCLVRPLTDALREHLEENVSEDAQWFGGALAVEPRYVCNLVAALRDAGFVVEAR